MGTIINKFNKAVYIFNCFITRINYVHGAFFVPILLLFLSALKEPTTLTICSISAVFFAPFVFVITIMLCRNLISDISVLKRVLNVMKYAYPILVYMLGTLFFRNNILKDYCIISLLFFMFVISGLYVFLLLLYAMIEKRLIDNNYLIERIINLLFSIILLISGTLSLYFADYERIPYFLIMVLAYYLYKYRDLFQIIKYNQIIKQKCISIQSIGLKPDDILANGVYSFSDIKEEYKNYQISIIDIDGIAKDLGLVEKVDCRVLNHKKYQFKNKKDKTEKTEDKNNTEIETGAKIPLYLSRLMTQVVDIDVAITGIDHKNKRREYVLSMFVSFKNAGDFVYCDNYCINSIRKSLYISKKKLIGEIQPKQISHKFVAFNYIAEFKNGSDVFKRISDYSLGEQRYLVYDNRFGTGKTMSSVYLLNELGYTPVRVPFQQIIDANDTLRLIHNSLYNRNKFTSGLIFKASEIYAIFYTAFNFWIWLFGDELIRGILESVLNVLKIDLSFISIIFPYITFVVLILAASVIAKYYLEEIFFSKKGTTLSLENVYLKKIRDRLRIDRRKILILEDIDRMQTNEWPTIIRRLSVLADAFADIDRIIGIISWDSNLMKKEKSDLIENFEERYVYRSISNLEQNRSAMFDYLEVNRNYLLNNPDIIGTNEEGINSFFDTLKDTITGTKLCNFRDLRKAVNNFMME